MALNASRLISTVLYLLLTGTFRMITRVSSDLGEEIGWRGFLVPEFFKNIGYTRTSLLGGAVCALWHYPLLISSNYNSGSGEPLWFALICFTIMVIGDSFINTWLRLKSGSLWVAAIAHPSHNLYIQSICTPFTPVTGKTLWFII